MPGPKISDCIYQLKTSMEKHYVRFRRLRILRILSQGIFAGYFVFVFIRSLDPFSKLTNPFLRFDPIIYLSNTSPDPIRIGIIFMLIILTIIFGRFFCGWICPLGALIDTIDLINSKLSVNIKKLFLKMKLGKYVRKAGNLGTNSHETNLRVKKTGRLSDILIEYPPSMFLLGLVMVTVFSPIPIFQFLHPGIWIIRIFALHNTGIAFLIFLALVSGVTRRFWCRYICPLGALYGLIGEFSILKLRINGCSNCGLCSSCPMGAIQERRSRIIYSRCILCFDFESKCPRESFTYSYIRLHGNTENAETDLANMVSLTRRRFITTGIILSGSAALGFILPGRSFAGTTNLLRPPGVTDEALFIKRCLRCQQCVRSCPNGIIKPTGISQSIEEGLVNLYTPHLEFSEYGCDYYCQVCQIVCPNNAIPLQSLEEKQKSRIGIAKIDEKLCIVFKEKKNCIVCEEFCPVPEKAIKLKDKFYSGPGGTIKLRYPEVDEELCIGCGICEAMCPVEEKAIRIFKEV